MISLNRSYVKSDKQSDKQRPSIEDCGYSG